jgi:hypothetical protein
VRLIKMVGLAVIAALAAMAVLGAGTASATRLCKTNTLPCGSIVASGTTGTGELTGTNEAVLTSGFAVVKCKTSSISGKTTSEGGGAGVNVTDEITSASASNCTCNLGGEVKALAEGLPWKMEVSWTKEMNGTGTTSNPKGSFTCAGEKCIYSTASLSSTMTGGKPMTIATESSLKKVAGSGLLCSETATIKATYTKTSNELFISES